MLPIIESPIYSVKLLSLDEPVQFRPFDVKEEQIILLAAQEGDNERIISSVFQILTNCTFGKIKVEDLPSFDVELLILNIRSKSVGEVIEFGMLCQNCNVSNKLSVNVEDIQLKINEEHSKKIMINDQIGVVMRYPSLKLVEKHDLGRTKELELVALSIEKIFDADSVYKQTEDNRKEFVEWVEKLSMKDFSKIVKFFETMPELYHTVQFACKDCGTDQTTRIHGLKGFFG